MYSCDTIGCCRDTTVDGSVIFAKNSDRYPCEAHEVVVIPEFKLDDEDGEEPIQCTYRSVNALKGSSHKCILSKPIWVCCFTLYKHKKQKNKTKKSKTKLK